MKRIPLFWKIWLMCESTIIVTAVVCIITLIWIVPWIGTIQRTAQVEQAKTLAIELVKEEDRGKRQVTITEIESMGFVINVQDNNQKRVYATGGIAYPAVLARVMEENFVGYQFGIEIEYFNQESESGVIFPLDVSAIPNFYPHYGFEVVANDQSYNVVLVDAVTSTLSKDDPIFRDFEAFANQSQAMFVVLVVGLIVATIFAFLIARFITKRVKRLNTTAKQMEKFEIEVQTETKSGDEFVQLENSVYQMYGKLRLTIDELDDEMQQNLQLETDKQVFMRGATHELKTPLMALSSMVEGMVNDIPAFEDRDYYLQRCADYIDKMQVLVNEILDVSRIEHVQSEERSAISAVISENIALYNELNEETKIHFYNEASKNSEINMPYNYFQKIVSNLMSNAVLYHKPGSEIVVRLNDESLSFSNQFENTENLDAEQLLKPFESNNTSGHGLGLYIVKLFLERYQINFHLDINNDTQVFTFTIDL
ncbi:sensor histidine kinase [Culicoidibacter larvae]|uniref:histidine kinase n=1 Tax=Culicoidibacter larvae TaxID=2579976 RepID=A0A5R8QBK9_9FIRM|nr:HAMP domain-containing sensor histidine kinase [Culicoidibacter larvae]TLG73928.1 HAMP domain-containing histidine kinase [Culicoidibacter larvae]